MSAGTITEKDVGQQCDELAESLGWLVERYEQPRATMVAGGLPDRRYVHRGRRLRLWVELKKPGGKLTSSQYLWLLAEWHTGAHATVCDTLGSLGVILSLLGRDAGRGEALRKCREFIDLTALRGFRDEPKPRKRPTKRAA